MTIINYVAPNSRSVSPYPQTDSRELGALQYFKTCAAPELAGSFSPDLWSTFVLRLAYNQSSVHHALVALGTVHQAFTSSGFSDFSDYANREYSRAISDVVELAGNTEAIETVLTTCILFACLENLRGHYRSSLSHLISGLNVLEEDQRRGRPQQASCIPRELLISLFIRMDSQRMDLGGAGSMPGTMLSIIARPAIPSCFSSLDEARQQLDLLYYHILQMIYWAEQASLDPQRDQTPEIWHGLYGQQQALQSMRQRWEEALKNMLGAEAGGQSQLSPRDPGVLVLDMANDAIKIMLSVDIVEPELDYDKHENLFHSMVCKADEYILRTAELRPKVHSSPSLMNGSPGAHSTTPISNVPSQSSTPKPILPRPEPTTSPVFTLMPGCVNVLYLTAARCRNPEIRHRALDLLRKCNRREGLWDSRIAAHIAENVVAIEEQKAFEAVRDSGLSPGTNRIRTRKGIVVFIPEESRVKMVDLKFGPEGHGKAMCSFEQPTRASGTSTGDVPSGMDTTGLGELFEW